MRRSLLVICVAVLPFLACRSGSRQPPPEASALGPSRPFWLRDIAILAEPDGGPWRTIERPVRVELYAGGKVGPATPSTETWQGYLPPASLEKPSEKTGLALYAQRTADLHLGAPDGLVVGRIHRGAFVGAVPGGDGQYIVAMTDFREDSSSVEALPAYVEADALGPEPAPLVEPPPVGRLVKEMPALPLWRPSYEGGPVAQTICGDLRVVGENPTMISQYHAGIELLGWVDGPIAVSRGPARCTLRTVVEDHERLLLRNGATAADRTVVDAIPPGYVGLNLLDADPMAPLMMKGGSVHWLIQTIAGPRCSEWRFKKGAFERKSHSGPAMEIEGELRRKEWQTIDGRKTFASFGVEYQRGSAEQAGSMTLYGPHFDSVRKGGGTERWGYRCADVYNLVGVTESAFRMLPIPPGSLLAWHPHDEEHWFFDREACETAARAAGQALAPDSVPPGGFHVDCYDELHDPDLR